MIFWLFFRVVEGQYTAHLPENSKLEETVEDRSPVKADPWPMILKTAIGFTMKIMKSMKMSCL